MNTVPVQSMQSGGEDGHGKRALQLVHSERWRDEGRGRVMGAPEMVT